MKFIIKSFSSLVVLTISVLTLSACDMHHETYINSSKVQLEESEVVREVPVEEFGENEVVSFARDYARYGDGPLNLTVLYDPASRVNTAMNAGAEAARLNGLFREQGVNTVDTSILPVKGQGDVAVVLVTYDTYSAHAPKDCGLMAGLEGSEVEAEAEYKLGCSVETLFARQIAHPDDLKGQSLDGVSDGRPSGNAVDAQRAGLLNKPLGGLSVGQ